MPPADSFFVYANYAEAALWNLIGVAFGIAAVRRRDAAGGATMAHLAGGRTHLHRIRLERRGRDADRGLVAAMVVAGVERLVRLGPADSGDPTLSPFACDAAGLTARAMHCCACV
jgi:hypothetical protein